MPSYKTHQYMERLSVSSIVGVCLGINGAPQILLPLELHYKKPSPCAHIITIL